MVDFDGVIGFEWDEGNDWKSLAKHDVSQVEAEQVFISEPLVRNDDVHSRSEPRLHALGVTSAGRWLHVTFTLRDDGTKIRVISARDMTLKEWKMLT
jgi:uncharacterized DUF497 family protein